MFDPVTTAPDTLLGLLRSGHGEGARQALSAERTHVLPALDSCVLNDPRPVPAVESRSLYYARLYDRLGADLGALEGHLFADDDWTDEDADRTTLPLAVLGELARRGRADAVSLLRRYTTDGRDWSDALSHLAVVGGVALHGLLPVALERAEDDDELYECVRESRHGRPWRAWASECARLRRVVERVDLDLWRRELGPAARAMAGRQTSTPTVDQVLADAAASPRRSAVCGRRLASVARPEHRGLILAAAWAGPEGARVAALRCLGELADPMTLDIAEDACTPGTPDTVRHAAAHAAARLRTPHAVRRARAWLSGPAATGDALLRDAALAILAAAGDPDDGPQLIDALYRRCAAHAAARAGNPGHAASPLPAGFQPAAALLGGLPPGAAAAVTETPAAGPDRAPGAATHACPVPPGPAWHGPGGSSQPSTGAPGTPAWAAGRQHGIAVAAPDTGASGAADASEIANAPGIRVAGGVFPPAHLRQPDPKVGELLAGIGRLGLREGLVPVQGVYQASNCAGTRSRAADTLARIQPDFASTTAVDCLWDCQSTTRLLAAEHVDTALPEVREQLRALAVDGAEDESVRAVARARLAGRHVVGR